MPRLFVEKYVAAHLEILVINGTAQVTSGRSRCSSATAGCKSAYCRRLGDIGPMFVFGTCCGGRDAAGQWIRHIVCFVALRGDAGHGIRWRHHFILFAAVPAGTCACGGAAEGNGVWAGPFADLNLPPTPAGLAKNIMARLHGFMAQSLVLPLPRAGGMRHHETRMKMRADQVSTASSLPK